MGPGPSSMDQVVHGCSNQTSELHGFLASNAGHNSPAWTAEVKEGSNPMHLVPRYMAKGNSSWQHDPFDRVPSSSRNEGAIIQTMYSQRPSKAEPWGSFLARGLQDCSIAPVAHAALARPNPPWKMKIVVSLPLSPVRFTQRAEEEVGRNRVNPMT